MGEIFSATCKSCGFKAGELYTGFGFKDAGVTYMQPSICPKCKSFALRDDRHQPQLCRKCNAEMVFYGDKHFRKKFFGKEPFLESIAEDKEHDLERGHHVCPGCGKITLVFTSIGAWD